MSATNTETTNGKSISTNAEMPVQYTDIIALIDAGPLGCVPIIGCLVEGDKEPVLFCHGSDIAYEWKLVRRWTYLKAVAPSFCTDGWPDLLTPEEK